MISCTKNCGKCMYYQGCLSTNRVDWFELSDGDRRLKTLVGYYHWLATKKLNKK